MKENKTKDSQIRATMEYQKRKNIVTIACKVTKEYKEDIEKHYKSKGYKSFNAYMLDLIKKDIENDKV